MRALWQKLSKYAQGLILIGVAVLLFGYGTFAAQVATRSAQEVAAQVAEQHSTIQDLNTEALTRIEAAGRFEVCVWEQVIRPRNRDKPNRTINGIRRCHEKYIEGGSA